MSILSIVLIAVALAMDAFGVSISSGIAIAKMRIRHALVIASFFGIFQGVMPLLGWSAGQGVKVYVATWDHWIAFFLLVAIGVKMIYEAFKTKGIEKRFDALYIYVLFVLAIATSIDALAVGLTLSLVDMSIMYPVLIIGAVTFIMSFVGTYIGAFFGHLFENKVEILAGLLLIGIGVKILIQHTLGS